MKAKLTLLFIAGMLFSATEGQAQSRRALNVSGGLGTYEYTHHPVGVFQVNYEIGVTRNFTIAPFFSYYQYSHSYNVPTGETPERMVTYNETVMPVGLKGSYYFNDLLGLDPKFDVYSSLSLGYSILKYNWEDGYAGPQMYNNVFNRPGRIYADIHVGAEYHITKRFGVFMDLSSDVASLGIAIH